MATIVDTTVLTDALLKSGAQGERARSALENAPESLLPVYAIKEFKAGPLHYYVWYHNKVVEASSWTEAVHVISANLGHRKNLPATALHALGDFLGSIGKELPADIQNRYPQMNLESAQLNELRIWLKQKILRAWRRRQQVTTSVVAPLTCYKQADIAPQSSGQLDDSPTTCGVSDCCLREKYILQMDKLDKLSTALIGERREIVRRRQALNRLRSHPTKFFEERHCRNLGDAVFALECPEGGEILTTNERDHKPLAAALGLIVKAP